MESPGGWWNSGIRGVRSRLAHLKSAEAYLEFLHDGFAQNGKNIQVQALSFFLNPPLKHTGSWLFAPSICCLFWQSEPGSAF